VTKQACPPNNFPSGGGCATCSPTCATCTGPSSSNCVKCNTGQFSLGGTCVIATSDGLCTGSSLVANPTNGTCDSKYLELIVTSVCADKYTSSACDAKCTKCSIPNFSQSSTIGRAQCTGCVPGFVLSQGKCVTSCPTGTFVSPQDNLTCTR
jgi:hypothetical protein